MTARLPTAITCGPFVYAVTDDWEAYTRLGEHPDTYGYTNHKALTITINPRLAFASMADTLWHEVKHVVCRTVGVADDEAMKEEEAINRTAAIEVAVLRDNPDLVAYLLARPDSA